MASESTRSTTNDTKNTPTTTDRNLLYSINALSTALKEIQSLPTGRRVYERVGKGQVLFLVKDRTDLKTRLKAQLKDSIKAAKTQTSRQE